MHWLGLAKSVTAILRLAVYLWVEVHIVQDDGICPCQVEPLAPCPSGQQEGKDTLGWVIEPTCTLNSQHMRFQQLLKISAAENLRFSFLKTFSHHCKA